MIYPMLLPQIFIPPPKKLQPLESRPSVYPSEEETHFVTDSYLKVHSQGWSEEVLSSLLISLCVLRYEQLRKKNENVGS